MNKGETYFLLTLESRGIVNKVLAELRKEMNFFVEAPSLADDWDIVVNVIDLTSVDLDEIEKNIRKIQGVKLLARATFN